MLRKNQFFNSLREFTTYLNEASATLCKHESSRLCKEIVEMEAGHKGLLFPTGMSAISSALIAFAEGKKHFLISDGVYSTTRDFCDKVLRSFDVEITYFDPAIGKNINNLIKANTKLVFCESPSSWSYEVQDIPAISEIAKRNNLIVVCDNTLSTPLFFNPIKHNVDIVVHSLSKYISGHTDVKLGILIFSNETVYKKVKDVTILMGLEEEVSFLDEILAERSLKTLKLRLEKIQETTYKIINFLKSSDRISAIYHPSLENLPGHKIWKRDFKGACGLLTLVLKDTIPISSIEDSFNSFKYIKLNVGWGGTSTVIRPLHKNYNRLFSTFTDPERTFRISIGLEDPESIIFDLEKLLK